MKLELGYQKTQKTIQKKPKKKKKTVFTEPRQDILCKNPIEELNRMKKILVIAMLLVTSILFSNCSKEVVSAAECGPIVDQMFTNLVKELKPEEAEKAKSMEAAIKPGVIKECTSGKYNLDCLKAATNIAALQTCKK